MEERIVSIASGAWNHNLLRRAIAAVIMFALAAFSFTSLAAKYSSADTYAHEIEQLDNRKNTAVAMSLAAVAASAGVSCIPDDMCTPIANELAEIGKGLGLVTGAILLEKYAMTILGYALFGVVFPLSLLVFAVTRIVPMDPVMRRSCCFGVGRVLLATALIWSSVPLSVKVSDMVYSTYEESFDETIAVANHGEQVTQDNSSQGGDEGEKKEFTFSLEGVAGAIGDMATSVGNAVGGAVETVTTGVAEAIVWAKDALTRMTEGFAVMVVTTCVIPVLVPLAMVGVVKLLFQPGGTSMPALPAAPTLPEMLGRKPRRKEEDVVMVEEME